MSKFICKSIFFKRFDENCVINPMACYNKPLTLRFLSSSSSVSVSPNEPQFTVSYLMNSLGFSLEASKTISNQVSFKTSHTKADKAISFLRNYGFTQNQIPRLVKDFPKILSYDTERNILPKLEFLESKGIPRPELTESLASYPTLLGYSLDNQIIPAFEFLRNLLPSEAEAAVAVQRHPNLLVTRSLTPNVSTLLSHGVPHSNVAKFVSLRPRGLCLNSVQFRDAAEEVSKMGFDPSKVNFLVAVSAKVFKSKWESKVRLYKKLGWSENDISRAFLRYPCCMTTSEDKITLVMEFFVREMGLKPVDLAEYPMVITYSLKRRILPRVRVFQALVSKGLLKERCSLNSLVMPMEKFFLQRYVTPYDSFAPELLEVYKNEKSNLSSLTIEN